MKLEFNIGHISYKEEESWSVALDHHVVSMLAFEVTFLAKVEVVTFQAFVTDASYVNLTMSTFSLWRHILAFLPSHWTI